MKAEIILTIVWTSLCISERQQRSTVLTDESKRIIEHFDFSNFDKQEALNYLDRQRFENQIRGKRSHTKIKRDRKHINLNIPSDLDLEKFSKTEERNKELEPTEILDNGLYESSAPIHESGQKLIQSGTLSRNRRGHRLKKKSKNRDNYSFEEFNNVKVNKEHKSRRKKKKTKKKKKRKKKRHYWDKWSEWSPCSVTCGRGRKIRWRRCIAKNCTTGELEMGEKTCQLPACNLLTKLLGL